MSNVQQLCLYLLATGYIIAWVVTLSWQLVNLDIEQIKAQEFGLQRAQETIRMDGEIIAAMKKKIFAQAEELVRLRGIANMVRTEQFSRAYDRCLQYDEWRSKQGLDFNESTQPALVGTGKQEDRE